MKLVDGSLEKTLKAEATKSDSTRYFNFKDKLREQVYPKIDAGVALADGTLLTDHGILHTNKVIERASDVVKDLSDDNRLSTYEIQILLFSILVHDTGNISGRKGHAKRSAEIASKLMHVSRSDIFEKRIVGIIAIAHSGGKGLDDLELATKINNNTVRPKLIASILRFADELADDRSRSAWGEEINIPTSSEVYHLYAHCLHSVNVNSKDKAIELTFGIEQEYLCKKWGKDSGEIYLIDEILLRIFKTYQEMQYCNLGLTPEMRFDKVKVLIGIYKNTTGIETPKKIEYTLETKGYPKYKDIYQICPELSNYDNNKHKLDGELLFKEFCNDADGEENGTES